MQPIVNIKDRSLGMDVVRAISIVSVLIAHSAYWIQPAEWYYSIITPIIFGVEPFFVLGGFLAAATFVRMLGESQDEAFSFGPIKNYWVRRWARTLPNYFLFLTIFTISFYVFRDGFELPLSYLVFSQNLFQLSPQFFSHSWSLATQEWFYLVFPVLLLSFGLTTRFFRSNTVLFACLAVVVFSFVTRSIMIQQYNPVNLEGLLRRIAVLRADSIIIGVWIGWIFFRRSDFLARHSGTLLIVGLVTYVCLAYARRIPEFAEISAVQLFFYPALSLSLALTLPWLYEAAFNFSKRMRIAIESISKWSYSIYLSHVFFLDAFFLIAKSINIINNRVYMALLLCLVMFIVFLSSALLYRYFEKPAMRRILANAK